jgi:hypothetical protein
MNMSMTSGVNTRMLASAESVLRGLVPEYYALDANQQLTHIPVTIKSDELIDAVSCSILNFNSLFLNLIQFNFC